MGFNFVVYVIEIPLRLLSPVLRSVMEVVVVAIAIVHL